MYCFVSFSVLFVCTCVLNYCRRVATQLQLSKGWAKIRYTVIIYILYTVYLLLAHLVYHIIYISVCDPSVEG